MKMFKTLIAVTFLLLITSSAWSEDFDTRLETRNITWYSVPTNTAVTYILPNSAAYSQRFDNYKMAGFYGLMMQLSTTRANTGNYGKLNVEYHVSNDGKKFISPTAASRIFTGISCESMTFNSAWNYIHNGNWVYSTGQSGITDTGYMMSAAIPIPPYRYFKIYIKETHGNREVSPTAVISIQ